MIEVKIKTHDLSRVTLEDGTQLVTRCTITTTTDIRQTPFGTFNFGPTYLGPRKQYIIRPDGTEELGDHLSFLKTRIPSKPKKRGFFARLFA